MTLGLVVLRAPATAQDLELSCREFPSPPTEADLRQRFGADNVVTDSIVGFDDGPVMGTVVYPEDPTRRLDVFWFDTARTRPQMLRVRGDSWTSAAGLQVGDDLKSIERLNGWPFRLGGFSRPVALGGRVISWGQGRLNGPEFDGCFEGFHFQPSYDGTTPPDAMRQVGRLIEVSSGHPAMQVINPNLVAITLFYPHPVTR